MLKTLLASTILAAGVATAAIAAPTLSSVTPNNGTFGGPAQSNAFGSDMSVVHAMLVSHDQIKRTVTNLPDGIRTVTESDDPQVAKEIKEHVASMSQRLKDGRVFNVASHALPRIFANSDKIRTDIEQTPKGVIVTQTSTDPAAVTALQTHAGEVSDLVRGGMVALMRQVQANRGPIAEDGAGPHGQMGPGMMRGMMGHDAMSNGGHPMMADMMQPMMQSGGPMGVMTP